MTWLLSASALGLTLTTVAGQSTPNQGRAAQPAPSGQRSGGDPSRPGQRPDWKPWWQDEIIKKEIKLTPDQDRKIQAIWDSTRPELEKYAQELKKQETELQRLMSPEVRADLVTVMMQIDRAEVQRTAAHKTQTMMFYKMHRILMPDQDTKLKTIQDQRDRGRRGGGGPR